MRLSTKESNSSGSKPRPHATLSVPTLRPWGLKGGLRIRDLQRVCRVPRAAEFPIPRAPGVYIVIRQSRSTVRFPPKNCCGRFKRRNFALPIAKLSARWAGILYIGRADSGAESTPLHSQLLSCMRFGLRGHSAHWGDSCICQLANAGRLQMSWKLSRSPLSLAMEKQPLAAFMHHRGRRSIASFTG